MNRNRAACLFIGVLVCAPLLAFVSAWLGMELEAAWKKYLFLLGLIFLVLLLTPVLALNGVLFEPFSGILAASFAMLIGVMVGDRPARAEPGESAPVAPAA